MYRFSYLERIFFFPFEEKILFYFVDKPPAPLEKQGMVIRRVSQLTLNSSPWEMMPYFFSHSPSLFAFRNSMEIEFSGGWISRVVFSLSEYTLPLSTSVPLWAQQYILLKCERSLFYLLLWWSLAESPCFCLLSWEPDAFLSVTRTPHTATSLLVLTAIFISACGRYKPNKEMGTSAKAPLWSRVLEVML